MNTRALVIILFSFLFSSSVFSQEQKSVIYGSVVDKEGQPIQLVNIAVEGAVEGAVTDEYGNYSLNILPDNTVKVHYTYVGYGEKVITLLLKPGEKREVDVKMNFHYTMLTDVVVEDSKIRESSLTPINPKTVSKVPGASVSIESIVKTMPGVASNNEMSTQYSVRGGNFDENLVYVNDIQIYKPFLVRSGKQEGLSFLNSDLVSSILFSAGGFGAKYGDKMSSVLDIKYKHPIYFGGSASLSLLGASAHVEGASDNGMVSYLFGVRQKSNQYMLNSMETTGEYKPSFTDFQGLVSFRPTTEWEFNILANYSRNIYHFEPEDRTTDFGTFNEALRLKIYFEGKEVDKFVNYMSGFSAIYSPHDDLRLKFITSVYHSDENVTYDVLGQYWIGKLGNAPGDDSYGEVVENQGVGSYLNHARNYLDVTIVNAEHRGIASVGNHSIEWGVKAQHEKIIDEISQWQLLDSSGYSLPYPVFEIGSANPQNPELAMNDVVKSNIDISSNRFNGFFQDGWEFNNDSTDMTLTYGVRATYWDMNNDFLISPRVTLSYIPNWKNDFLFRFSSGLYYQPPFYKEMKKLDGTLVTDLEAQKSVHFVGGTDYNFAAWGRPFKFVGEVFYKHLDNLIPYEIDNVRIQYFPELTSHGYSAGLDMKVNGEFVDGVESWVSLSVMQTEEDIDGDYYITRHNAAGEIVTSGTEDQVIAEERHNSIGYRSRPSDQRVNFSLFFQDYLPKHPSYKMHLKLVFGSGLPFGLPGSKNYKSISRVPPYRRVDIGFSKQIVGEGVRLKPGHFLNNFKSMWLSLEVFNLLQINNTVSYFWVRDISNRQLAVPNYLTPRQLNLKLNIEF
ncbi:MAG: TonB-dependent receptor [Bacteroidota bacterium]|nr:TonB-dependent receptor [Bacteroidota bacterium]